MALLPLDGIRVIDFSHSWAAPHCARLLADFGAEVIKIEYPKRLCLLRGARREREVFDRHPGWLQVNRNKLSVTLDLDRGQDRSVLAGLVAIADILITNARPGVMERLGLGYETVRSVSPEIIYLSMSAFGDCGPYRSFVGYGAIFEGLGGIQSLTAYDASATPSRIKEIDVSNGVAAACAVMTALLHRQTSGAGQYIDLSQFEAASHALIGERFLAFTAADPDQPPVDRRLASTPENCYPCKGSDCWITLTIRTDQDWRAFCKATGQDALSTDPRFMTAEARARHVAEINALIAAWSMRHEAQPAMTLLQGHGLAACAVLNVNDLRLDPHLATRGYFVKPADDSPFPFMGMPFSLSGVNASVRGPGPALGAHNEFVQRSILRWNLTVLGPVEEDRVRMAFDGEPGNTLKELS